MEAEQQENSALLQFLLELVLGQWNVVPNKGSMPGGQGDENGQKALPELAHLLAEELRTLILHKALVHPRKHYRFIQHGLLLLNKDHLITAMGGGTAAFFGLSENTLYKSDFTAYLTTDSQKDFMGAVLQLEQQAQPLLRELHFQTGDTTELKADCFIGRVLYKKDMLMVSFFGLKPLMIPPEDTKASRVSKSLAAAQQVYDYIQGHTEGPLPNAHEFARRFGTNEYELKREFKKCFGTSIYQYYTTLRLERARALILGTHRPLWEIARECGFEDYSGFAKAYGKQYGKSPAKARERNAE